MVGETGEELALEFERTEPGMNVGASALRRVAETEGETGWVSGCLSLLLVLTLRDDGCELLGDSVLRSEIMRCRLLSASSPCVSWCFFVAAFTAASMADTGDDVLMDSDSECDCGCAPSSWASTRFAPPAGIATGFEPPFASLPDEAADVGRCGADELPFAPRPPVPLLPSFVLVLVRRPKLAPALPLAAGPLPLELPPLLPRLVPPEMVVVFVSFLPLFFLSPPPFLGFAEFGADPELERETDADDSCER
jgi:hypothetical protein